MSAASGNSTRWTHETASKNPKTKTTRLTEPQMHTDTHGFNGNGEIYQSRCRSEGLPRKNFKNKTRKFQEYITNVLFLKFFREDRRFAASGNGYPCESVFIRG